MGREDIVDFPICLFPFGGPKLNESPGKITVDTQRVRPLFTGFPIMLARAFFAAKFLFRRA